MRLRATLAGRAADLVRRAPRGATGLLSRLLGALLFATVGRRTALDNLARAFPGWSRTRRLRVALAAYRRFARAAIEFLHSPRYGDEEIRARVELEGLEGLTAARAEGGGGILVTGHFGNWEWLARRVAIAGHPFAAVVKEPEDAGLAERLRAARRAAGVETIDHDDARGALRWLRQGKVLGIVMDQEPRRPEDGAVAPLFGLPTRTYIGPFRLARMAGAPVFTFFCRATGPGRYRAVAEPLPLSDAADRDAAVAADAAEFNARLEAAVRRDPDHWLWMYPRWKRIRRERVEAAVGRS